MNPYRVSEVAACSTGPAHILQFHRKAAFSARFLEEECSLLRWKQREHGGGGGVVQLGSPSRPRLEGIGDVSNLGRNQQ